MSEAHYDAVIIGSGFGGAVMAYRLAEAGLRVRVCERGQAYPPGSFPRTPAAMGRSTWDPVAGKQGLFDFWSFRHMDAVVTSGLGGGSLVYSNVLLRKDERWFVREQAVAGPYEYWPVRRADLDAHYDAVERMIAPTPYPFEHVPYRDTRKTHALREAAASVDGEFLLPPLAVRFGNPGEPPHPGEPLRDPGDRYGMPRYTCRLCGECNIGCNYGSKETLDLNYLSQAERHGAELAVRTEVRRLEPLGGNGWRLTYVEHPPEWEGRPYRRSQLEQRTLTATRVVLAAGTFGSTFLLLRCKRDVRAMAGLSPALGHRFSGNGDMLTLALRCRRRDDDRAPRLIEASHGPVITGAVRVPDAVDHPGALPQMNQRGIYVEDAGFPAFLAWIIESAPSFRSLGRAAGFVKRYLSGHFGFNHDSNLSAEVGAFIGDARLTDTSLPLLCMGRDLATGSMGIDANDNLDVDWAIDASSEYVERVRRVCQRMTDALAGDYADNPLLYLDRLITVHPLGGCPMGRNKQEGVVDAWGRVFDFPGLYVADGSIMPGPVGANPALTIAALADRCADGILRELGRD
ncbi:GMC oxidoreductase [Haliangium sp.]|uniref:GMC oxidoreductase n=1 Tax=Haliangium sp. TaxID=2663208 RepID=UPI003D1229CA